MRFSSSLNLGKISGIPIFIHWSVIPMAVWAGLNSSDLMPSVLAYLLYPLLLGIIMLHELGHALTSLKLNVPVKSITLMAFGGVANIPEEDITPKKELLITLAGPAVNVVIGLILCPFILPMNLTGDTAWSSLNFLQIVFILNIVILIFNALPIYPMDGGRAVKAITQIFINKKIAFLNVIALNFVFGILAISFFLQAGNYVAVFILTLIGFFGCVSAFVKLKEASKHSIEDTEGYELAKNFNPTQMQEVLAGYLKAMCSTIVELGITKLPRHKLALVTYKGADAIAIKIELKEETLKTELGERDLLLLYTADKLTIVISTIYNLEVIQPTEILMYATVLNYDKTKFELLSKALQGVIDQLKAAKLKA